MKQDKADVDEFISHLKKYAGAEKLTGQMCLYLIEYATVDRYVDRHSPLKNKNNALAEQAGPFKKLTD